LSDNGYPLKGLQADNPGLIASEAYRQDPTTGTVPDPIHDESTIGVFAWCMQQVKALFDSQTAAAATAPTVDQKAALDAANTPSASNAFATTQDLAAYSSPTSTVYTFQTDTGAPASGEIKMDNADPALATTLNLHNLNREGNNVSNVTLLMGAGDAIIIQDNIEGDKSYNFNITGAGVQTGGTGASGYIGFPVTLFSQGATDLEDDDIVVSAMYQDGAGTISNAVIDASNNIDGAALDAGTVVRSALEADIIDGTKIEDLAVDTEHLAADAVDGTKIADNAVDTEHIASGAVDTAELAADAVDGTKLADNAVDTEHIASGAVDTAELAADAVDGTKIADNAIGNEHIENDAVDTAQIADGAVGDSQISDIDGSKIDAGTIPASALESGAAGGSFTTLYCSVSGSGDGLGGDTSNRISAADMPEVIRGGQNFNLYMAAGTYNSTDTEGPFMKNSADFGSLQGKNFNILIEGDVTVGSLESVNTKFSIKSTGGTKYDWTVTDTFNMYNGSLITAVDGFEAEGETDTNDNVQEVTFDASAAFYGCEVYVTDLYCGTSIYSYNSNVRCNQVDAEVVWATNGGYFYVVNTATTTDGSNTGLYHIGFDAGSRVGNLSTDRILIRYNGFLTGSNIDVDYDYGSTEVIIGSFLHASVGYGGLDGTPSSDATSTVI